MSCDHCNFRTASRVGIKYHMTRHFPRSQTAYTCEKCGKKTNYINVYYAHAKKCGKVKFLQLKCNKCNFKTYSKKKLIKHTLENHIPSTLDEDCYV